MKKTLDRNEDQSALAAGAPGRGAKNPSRREERTKEIADALYRAAFRTVGEFGYAATTIQKITRSASVANGTYYNYFPSRNDLFEKLLPELGERLRAHVDRMIEDAASPAEAEQAILRGLFDFSNLNPEFYRILTEAETLVPKAHHRYILDMTQWYKDIFSRRAKGTAAERSDDEYEVLAVILLAAHHYLTLRYTRWLGGEGVVPEWVLQTYTALITGGLDRGPPIGEPPAGNPADKAEPDLPGQTIKFTSSIGSGRPFTNISAAATPLGCRTTLRPDGTATVELDLEPRLMSVLGTGPTALLASLGEIAAISALSPDREQILTMKPISISCNLIRTVQDGTLVAVARQDNSARHIRFLSVQIHRNGDPAQLIATVSVVVRLD